VATFFSVIMTVFNRTRYLEEAIKSVLDQTYDNFELVIVDDGSDDRGVKLILEKYKEFHGIKVASQEHKGLGAAMNYGVSQAKGEHICKLDSDDLLFSQALEVLNEYVEKFPNVDYFYSSRCTIDEEDRLIEIFKSVTFDRKKLLRRHIANALICWKKESFLEAGGFDESIPYAEDYDLALRMAEKFQFQNIDEVLYKVRRGSHKDRMTCLFDQMERSKMIKQIQQRARQRLHSPQN
jgi:glycosyltransferase involved in cell wall biosynthesis